MRTPAQDRQRVQRLLARARRYTDKTGRVIRLMPDDLVEPLREIRRMVGIEFGKPCEHLGTKAWWFVIFDRKKQRDVMTVFGRQLKQYQKRQART